YVGENKDIEIGANQNTIIHKDEIRNVKGENKLLIEKSLTQTIEKEFFLNIHQNLSAHIQDNTSLKSNSMQTKVEEQYSLESDNSTFDFQTDCEVKQAVKSSIK
ncbi:VgrG protein, partial [Campylobacter jejuni]